MNNDSLLHNQDDLIHDGDVAAKRRTGTWGGRRPGAGRKPTLKDAVSFTGEVEKVDMDALEAIADERGVSVASLVREAVAAYLKRRGR